VTPGTDQYVFGSPVFEKATITLENGNKFVVNAKDNNKQNVYIESAFLNGSPYSKNYIRYKDITEGGEINMQMSDQPNKTKGTKTKDKPFSLSGVVSY
jgi:putative alpha-1,2-mannosidase